MLVVGPYDNLMNEELLIADQVQSKLASTDVFDKDIQIGAANTESTKPEGQPQQPNPDSLDDISTLAATLYLAGESWAQIAEKLGTTRGRVRYAVQNFLPDLDELVLSTPEVG